MTGRSEERQHPTSVFVYGSCVTRDTLDALEPGGYEIDTYVARQSLISAFSGDAGKLDLSGITSAFQKRMLEGDSVGNLAALLVGRARGIQLVLWDLTDERLGVLVSPEGRVVTRTVEGIQSRLPHVLHWRHVPFASDEHIERWSAALRMFVDLLRRLDMVEATVLLAVPWAAVDESGASTPTSFGLSSSEANKALASYYDIARSEGITIGALHHDEVVAARDHRWGAAPFHYTHDTYLRIARVIDETAQPSTQKSTDRGPR